ADAEGKGQRGDMQDRSHLPLPCFAPERMKGSARRHNLPSTPPCPSPRPLPWPKPLPPLAVVALPVDAPALAVLHMLDADALARAEAAAVGAAARLVSGDARFLPLEPVGLPG